MGWPHPLDLRAADVRRTPQTGISISPTPSPRTNSRPHGPSALGGVLVVLFVLSSNACDAPHAPWSAPPPSAGPVSLAGAYADAQRVEGAARDAPKLGQLICSSGMGSGGHLTASVDRDASGGPSRMRSVSRAYSPVNRTRTVPTHAALRAEIHWPMCRKREPCNQALITAGT